MNSNFSFILRVGVLYGQGTCAWSEENIFGSLVKRGKQKKQRQSTSMKWSIWHGTDNFPLRFFISEAAWIELDVERASTHNNCFPARKPRRLQILFMFELSRPARKGAQNKTKTLLDKFLTNVAYGIPRRLKILARNMKASEEE